MAADPLVVIGQNDYYSVAPDTLASSIPSSDSLAVRATSNLFGVDWYYSNIVGGISSINGVDMTGRADGVKELATATYRTFHGVELAVSDNTSWLEKIYDLLYESRRSGDVVEKVSIPQLLREFHEDDRSFWNNYVNDIYNGFYYNFSTGAVTILRRATIPNLLAAMNSTLYGIAHSYSWLGSDGKNTTSRGILTDVIGAGFQGLATIIGGVDDGEGRKTVWQWVDPTDPLNPSAIRNYEVTSLFDLFHSIAWLQNSLAKLEYVYASEEDIEFKEQEKPNVDAVKDSFFGDGEGAVNPDQIKDVAGISSGIKDSFGGAGSAGDAFQAINDSQSFWFFSQEVADALDTVNSPAVASEIEDGFWDQFVQDEGGFYSLFDLSPWDVESYLGG